VFHTDALIREEWHLKLALSITNWITEKCVHVGCLRDDHKACRMAFALIHFTHCADQAEQFLQCSITGEETWVNHAMSVTKKSVHDEETPIITSSKDSMQ
jgi:hypothetical protein